MESATHPRAISRQACACIFLTRVCVNSIRIARQEKIGDRTPSYKSRSRLQPTIVLMPIDSVDSCVTNHRIVRELRTDSAPSFLVHF